MSSLTLLGFLLLGQAEQERTIHNFATLVDRDWSSDRYAVSLQPSEVRDE